MKTHIIHTCLQTKRVVARQNGTFSLQVSHSQRHDAVRGFLAAVAGHAECGAALEADAVFSLQRVVEELAALDFPSSEGEFAVEPASASLRHLASYVGQGVYMRKVDADEEER